MKLRTYINLIVVPYMVLAIAVLVVGCAALQPGADPLVVRAEQVQTVARSTFDFVLTLDNTDRGFWRTNAPAFHGFCTALREPVPYKGAPMPRVLYVQLQLDDLKLAYKGAKTITNSNALYTALLVLQELSAQAAAWQTIATLPTYPDRTPAPVPSAAPRTVKPPVMDFKDALPY